MNIVKTIADLRAAVSRARGEGKRIGFGTDHGQPAPATSLVKKAGQRADFVVASIFRQSTAVRPQRRPGQLPRTLAADQDKLFEAGCHLLFAPSVEMYHGQASRPSFACRAFPKVSAVAAAPGISTVSPPWSVNCSTWCCRTSPYSVRKISQLAVIRTMVRDLNMPCRSSRSRSFAPPTASRSSCNGYLSADERATAPSLYRLHPRQLDVAIRGGRRDYPAR